MAMLRAALAATILCVASGTAEAESYRWAAAAAPPANAVVAPDGRARPVCQHRARSGNFYLGAFHDGACASDYGGEMIVGTRDLQFLTVVSGAAGGKWEAMRTDGGLSILPRNVARGLTPGWYGGSAFICSRAGVPGINFSNGIQGSAELGAAGCAIGERINGAQQQWALVN